MGSRVAVIAPNAGGACLLQVPHASYPAACHEVKYVEGASPFLSQEGGGEGGKVTREYGLGTEERRACGQTAGLPVRKIHHGKPAWTVAVAFLLSVKAKHNYDPTRWS